MFQNRHCALFHMLPPTNHIAKVGGGVLARQALISIACRAVVLHHNSITAYSGLYQAQTGERWDFHDPTLELMCWFNTSSIQFTSKVKKFVDQNMSRFNGVSLNDLVFRPTPRASGSQLLENLLHSFMSSYYSVSLCIDHQTVVVLTIWPNLQSPIPLQSVPYRKTDAYFPCSFTPVRMSLQSIQQPCTSVSPAMNPRYGPYRNFENRSRPIDQSHLLRLKLRLKDPRRLRSSPRFPGQIYHAWVRSHPSR